MRPLTRIQRIRAIRAYQDRASDVPVHPQPRLLWLYAAEQERCYGGSEEGGWWWDYHRHLITPYRVRRGPKAHRRLASLKRKHPTDLRLHRWGEEWPDHGSVLSSSDPHITLSPYPPTPERLSSGGYC